MVCAYLIVVKNFKSDPSFFPIFLFWQNRTQVHCFSSTDLTQNDTNVIRAALSCCLSHNYKGHLKIASTSDKSSKSILGEVAFPPSSLYQSHFERELWKGAFCSLSFVKSGKCEIYSFVVKINKAQASQLYFIYFRFACWTMNASLSTNYREMEK